MSKLINVEINTNKNKTVVIGNEIIERKIKIKGQKLQIYENVQGGIALTSPPCNRKQTSALREKALSVYQTNCEMAVVKAVL